MQTDPIRALQVPYIAQIAIEVTTGTASGASSAAHDVVEDLLGSISSHGYL